MKKHSSFTDQQATIYGVPITHADISTLVIAVAAFLVGLQKIPQSITCCPS